MATGLEVRSQIDSEKSKGLLFINGGAAVALAAFLPSQSTEPHNTRAKAGSII